LGNQERDNPNEADRPVPARRALFICTGNSARSQIAEGLLRSLGGKEYEVYSAGTHPSFVRPQAIKVMSEIGIDISSHSSKSLDQFVDQPFDYVITVCDLAKESCPVFYGAKRMLHWSIEDPVSFWGTTEMQLEAFRKARDEIRKRIEKTFAVEQTDMK
jgi:arsenate reductase